MEASFRRLIDRLQRRRTDSAEQNRQLIREHAELISGSTRAIAQSHDLLDRTRMFHKGPSTPELADEFAEMAVKSVLQPTPDGLDVLGELARAVPKQPR